MPQYDNTNSGVLFKNNKKKTPKHADYTGNINVDGTDCWLNAWVKESKNGKKYFSLSVRAKQQASQEKPSQEESCDDIPF